MSEWYAYEGGASVGVRGPEGGRIVLDLELGLREDPEDADARLTLESSAETAWGVVANLYGGWLYLALEHGSEAEARATFEKLKPELEKVALLIPDEDERGLDEKVATLLAAIASLEADFLAD
jgi:hypothetical protein